MKHVAGYDYLEKIINGVKVKTSTQMLYAPDGSIFYMPSGGDCTRYLTKAAPYKLKPDPIWIEKNRQWELDCSASLEISNAEREIRLEEQDLSRKVESARLKTSLANRKAELAAAHEALDNPKAPEPEPEVAAEPDPEAPKPKARAKK